VSPALGGFAAGPLGPASSAPPQSTEIPPRRNSDESGGGISIDRYPPSADGVEAASGFGLVETPVTEALARARDHLLGLQSPEGWWKGELETNVTMDAEDLLLRHVLGILDARTASAAADWIRSQQRGDGTWATFHGGPGDLSTTVEAYVALRLAGDHPDAPHLARARRFVLDRGGVEATRVFTRIWLALVGQWSWDDLPALPPEVILLPPRIPLNVYDFACWARQTIVPLTVVAAHRLVRPLPFDVDELFHGGGRETLPPPTPPTFGATFRRHSSPAARPATPDQAAPGGTAGAVPPGRPSRPQPSARLTRWFDRLDRVLWGYERLPAWAPPKVPLRRLALRLAGQWIIRRQEADGSWGGIQPPWVYSLLALHVLGYPLDHPAMVAGLAGLDRFTVHDERGRRLEACQSPVWDTALAAVALADAGVAPDDPALVRAGEWLLDQEVTVAGDWAVRRPDLPPGGWAFEFANVNYPDVDDTAEVVLALRRIAGLGETRCRHAIGRAVAWVEGMQSRGGGWAAFDADNTSRLCAALPFCDFGEVTDPPSADVTAHAVEMLADEPAADPGRLGEGIAWLRAEQEPSGSWFGRWGANHVYGTGAAVPALVAAGVGRDDPGIVQAVAWLERHQNEDGGWGEDLRSYDDPAAVGRGASTASQTAWALLALLAAGRHHTEPVRRAVVFLVDTQRPDGTWDEDLFTGTGFPGDFYINYHLYRHTFPLTALGRYCREAGP
jgi:squalene-hopene/tetraprenyl-beta-curcumene cyclase